MPIVEFSSRDLLRGKVVEPAWYRCRVERVGEAPSSDGKSVNYPVEVTILFNGDNGNKTFSQVPIDYNFNSKAIGFAVGFLAAFGVEPQPGQRIDLAAAEGKELDIFIENDTYQSRLVNRVNHKYRKANPEVTAAA